MQYIFLEDYVDWDNWELNDNEIYVRKGEEIIADFSYKDIESKSHSG